MTNQRVNRLIQILVVLQSGKIVCVADLMELNNCSRRTVYRDIHELKKQGVELKFEKTRNSLIIDGMNMLTPPQLTYKEAIVLLLLTQNIQSRFYVPCDISATLAAFKLESLLSPPVRKYCKEVLQYITVTPSFKTESDEFDIIFFSLIKAIHRKCVISFSYSLVKNLKTDMIVDPYHLHHYNNEWYLIGKSHFSNQVKRFLISSIDKLKLSKKIFKDKTCGIQKYFVEEVN